MKKKAKAAQKPKEQKAKSDEAKKLEQALQERGSKWHTRK
jgi:hypothetical protein